MSDFDNHKGAALVAGGSGGLGSVIALLLAARGAEIAITWRRNEAAAQAVAAAIRDAGGRVTTWQVDLENPAAVTQLLDDVVAAHDGIHTLVQAAGPHVPQRHVSTIDPAQFRTQIDADVVATFNLVRAALPALRNSSGSFIAVTTAATTRHAARDGLSSIPKGAVEALVRAIAAEEGRFGVRANCVGPGMLGDGMAQTLIAAGDLDAAALEAARRNTPLGRFGTADDIAEAVAFLASDRAGFITGQKLDVDGGYTV